MQTGIIGLPQVGKTPLFRILTKAHVDPAKGGQETDTSVTPHESFCVCEVEFAMEISLCFFINFEFDVTWQEKRQIS